MTDRELHDIFIKILSSELNFTELDADVIKKITPSVIVSLFKLSKKQDLAHIVSSSLYKNGLLTDEKIKLGFNNEEIISVYRYEQMKYAFLQICDILNSAGISYIPLKGFVIRPYYPKESMRTSCDIDILIKEEETKKAIDLLKKNGYTLKERNFHDISLYSPSNVHLELHFNILENIDRLDAILKDAWSYAVPKSESEYKFSDDFFAFHMFAHMSYHFVSSGCGIRLLMDIWVMEHKMKISHESARELLEKAGIYKFALEMSRLADVCFSDAANDENGDKLLSYIFEGGIYGSRKTQAAVGKQKNKGALKYILKRLFMPYKDMKIIYPVLKKVPILLPFCWIARFFKMLFGGKTKKVFSEIDMVVNVSSDEMTEIKAIREYLEI